MRNIPFNLYSCWFFFSPGGQSSVGRTARSRTAPTVHYQARLREGRAPRAAPGAGPRYWEGSPGRRGALPPPPDRSFPFAKAPLHSPTLRDGGGGRHFPPLHAPRPARPGPALPARGRCRRAVPASQGAPGSGKSLLRLGAAGRLPPSPGRSLLRRQRRCPPAPWRRSPCPRR